MKKKIVFLLVVFSLLTIIVFNGNTAKKPAKQNQLSQVKSAEINRIAQYRKDFVLKNAVQDEVSAIDLSAKSAIIVDAQNGEILFEKDSNLRLPPASITKILTGAIVLENLDLKKRIPVSKRASETEPNKIVMKEGEKMLVKDLLYGLFMISANDAAEVLAEGIDGNRETFIKKMKEKIDLLELKDTKFKNPSGLDEEDHFSSAYDISKITYYTLKTHPEIIEYAGEKEDYSVYPNEYNESHWWSNISSALYSFPELVAAKTGYTENAGNTFIGIGDKAGKKIIYVFVGSSRGMEDAKNLLYHGLSKLD